MRKYRHVFLPLLFAAFLVPDAHAHVGSKDVYEQISSGPYQLFVTVRMPNVIPGVATVELRSTGAPVSRLQITPLALTGEAAKHAPSPDEMRQSPADPAFFTGSLWMMATGSWQVRFEIAGSAGNAIAAVPVPAVATRTLAMPRGLALALASVGVLLVISMSSIVAAAVREATLVHRDLPSANNRRRAAMTMTGSLAVMVVAVYLGAQWWHVDAAGYAGRIYRPLQADALLSGNLLELKLHSFHGERGQQSRSNDDLLPDHGHLMHLYAIREPGMDVVFHLHPAMVERGEFSLALPAMPPGAYKLYGDIVHANGFPETIVTSIDVPAGMNGSVAGPDDAAATIAPLDQGMLGKRCRLPDGYTMVWDAPADPSAITAYLLRFRLLAPNGSPAKDVQLYMGMAGHAAFVKADGTVFAHIHPEGSVPMASMMLAGTSGIGSAESSNQAMSSMPEMTHALSNTVDFPYGFPSGGRYRIFVQMKDHGGIETGVFDTFVK